MNLLPAQPVFPLCDEQQYMFTVNETVPDIPMKIFFALEFSKSFSPEELSLAVETAIQGADVFGARCVVKDGRPHMAFLPYQKRVFPVVDFATAEEYQTYCKKTRITEINNRDKLWHIFIFSIAGSCYHIHFCFNHLIFDGICALLLNERILKVLLNKNEEFKWHPYADYLEKIKRYNASGQYLQDKVFWENRFLELSRSEYLFPDVTDADEEEAVKTLIFQTDKIMKKALWGYCSENHFSPHMVIVAVLARMISTKTGRKRFYFEIPIGNRAGADEKNSIGAYEISPPFIFDFTKTNNLLDLIESLKKQSVDYYRHKNFDWITKIHSEPYEKNYGRYIPQFCFSYFCSNKQPSASFAAGRHLHPESDLLPMSLYVSDTLDWQVMTFAYRYWDNYFSEEEVAEIHREVEAGISGIVEKVSL